MNFYWGGNSNGFLLFGVSDASSNTVLLFFKKASPLLFFFLPFSFPLSFLLLEVGGGGRRLGKFGASHRAERGAPGSREPRARARAGAGARSGARSEGAREAERRARGAAARGARGHEEV